MVKTWLAVHLGYPAAMAELADALDSGSSRGNSVEVQVLLAAIYAKILIIIFTLDRFSFSYYS